MNVKYSQLDFELALDRARHHLKEMSHQTVEWRQGDAIRLIHDYAKERREYSIFVEVAPLSLQPFRLLAGDSLHNLNSSLQFLAYSLTAAYTNPLPDKIAADCEFPIFGDQNRQGRFGAGPRLFRDGAVKRIRGMHPDAQVEIEELQPYHLGSTFTEHPLWQLYELARAGRHRFLHPSAAVFEGFGVKISGELVESKSRNVPTNPFGSGKIRSFAGMVDGRTEVARFPVAPIDPDLDVYIDVETPMGIVFATGTPLVSGKPIVETLSRIYDHVVDVVVPKLRPFL